MSPRLKLNAQLHLVDARSARANAKGALDNALGLSDTAPDYRAADVLKYSPTICQPSAPWPDIQRWERVCPPPIISTPALITWPIFNSFLTTDQSVR